MGPLGVGRCRGGSGGRDARSPSQSTHARPPVTSIASVGSLSIAANGTVVGFGSDAPPNPDGSGAIPPDKARNYLWINCP